MGKLHRRSRSYSDDWIYILHVGALGPWVSLVRYDMDLPWSVLTAVSSLSASRTEV